MLTIEADGRTIRANEGDTILAALRSEGIHVPTLCHLEGLPPSGACRLCVVEVEGAPTLTPACSFPVANGMKIRTASPRVLEARRTIVELLLASHPDDCLYCSRSGKCDLQQLSRSLGITRRQFHNGKKSKELDVSSPSIVRDPEKCILCGRCVRVCEEVQGVAAIDFVHRGSRTFIATAFNRGLNLSSCICCGQCVLVCPTGALSEHSSLDGVVAALRRVGFDRVFDTSFTADLTIMEEGSEFVDRIRKGGVLPMFTSCSPGWIKFVEEFYPEFIPNLSTCKGPQQMMGAVVKSFFAQREGVDRAKIVSVSIMPCTAKKFECTRPEMTQGNSRDVDYVLTTRELGKLLRLFEVNLRDLEPEAADTPFGERSTAGKLFGASGGVMEAAIRSVHYLITGRELGELRIQPLRGMQGCKELKVTIEGLEVGAAVVSGLGNARKVLDQIREGRKDLQFVEVMTCPGGCINGGGQPLGMDVQAVQARMKALYRIDAEETLRTSRSNPWVKRLYDEFLGQPLSERSHHLLHTGYHHREVVL